MTIGLKIINWYNEVSRNLEKIPECIKYFETELTNAKKEVRIYGNLEKASATLPGIVEERFGQLQQIEAILEYLNIEYRRLRSKTWKQYLSKNMCIRDADLQKVNHIMDQVKKTNPILLEK